MASLRAYLLPAVFACLAACGTVTQSGSGTGSDAGSDAGVSCDDDSDCPLSSPVCDSDDGFCRGCEAEAECSEATGRTHCDDGSGQCVGCTEHAHCTGAGGTVCDNTDLVCRGCQSHDECQSGFCDIDLATCVTAADVVIVDKDADAGTPCGTPVMPCQVIADGFAEAVSRHGPMGRKAVRILDSADPYGGNVAMPPNTYVLAEGAIFQYGALPTTNARVQVAAKGTWDGATFDADATAGHIVFQCGAMGDLIVRNITSLENSSVIAMDNGCETTIEDSVLADGVNVLSGGPGRATVRRSFIQNTDQPILAAGILRFENNVLVGSGLPGEAAFRTTGVNNDSLFFQHNTIGNHVSQTAMFGCVETIPTGAIAGNIIWGLPGATPIGCTPPVVTNNLMDPQLAGMTGSPITMAPMFNNAGGDDFTLMSASPAINAGDALYAPADDYDGSPRGPGGVPDLGCYEASP